MESCFLNTRCIAVALYGSSSHCMTWSILANIGFRNFWNSWLMRDSNKARHVHATSGRHLMIALLLNYRIMLMTCYTLEWMSCVWKNLEIISPFVLMLSFLGRHTGTCQLEFCRTQILTSQLTSQGIADLLSDISLIQPATRKSLKFITVLCHPFLYQVVTVAQRHKRRLKYSKKVTTWILLHALAHWFT